MEVNRVYGVAMYVKQNIIDVQSATQAVMIVHTFMLDVKVSESTIVGTS